MVRVGEAEKAKLRQRAGGKRRRRSADRFPEEAKPAKRPVALQLELYVTPVMQEDPDDPGENAQRHDRLEDADRAGTTPGSHTGHRAEHDDEERERDTLGHRVEVLQQRQLDEESDGAKQDEREHDLAQRPISRVIARRAAADRAIAHGASRGVIGTCMGSVYHGPPQIGPPRVASFTSTF